MFCSVDEAYNNRLRDAEPEKQECRPSWDNHNNNNNNQDERINFFSAQGSMIGTSLQELQQQEELHRQIKDAERRGRKKERRCMAKKNRVSHRHCIKSFVASVVGSDDLSSVRQGYDSQVYDHIKDCKYCRSQINSKMKNYYQQRSRPKRSRVKIVKVRGGRSSSSDLKLLGYKGQDVLIVVAILVLIVFMIDMLLKMSRKY